MKVYLYFLKNETNGLTKVGSSYEPYVRMKNVKYDQKGKYIDCVFKPISVHEIENRGVEEKAHQLLNSLHVEREWFRLEQAHINTLLKLLRLK